MGMYFLQIPKSQSKLISKQFGDVKRGWGSLPVAVTIGRTTWKTSIFPDKKTGVYGLPLKADVRKKEGILEGNTVTFLIAIQI